MPKNCAAPGHSWRENPPLASNPHAPSACFVLRLPRARKRFRTRGIASEYNAYKNLFGAKSYAPGVRITSPPKPF